MTHDHPHIVPGDIIAARSASSGIVFNTQSHSTVLFSRDKNGRFRAHWLNLARWIIQEYRRRPERLDYRIAHPAEFIWNGGEVEHGYIVDDQNAR